MSLVHTTAAIYVAHCRYLCRSGASAELRTALPLQIFMSSATDAVFREFNSERARVGGDNAAAEKTLTVAEAARRLGVSSARVYQLVASGGLDAESAAGTVRITVVSVQRRGIMSPQAGALLAPLSAWAILALAGGDAAMLRHVVGLLSDPDRSRARSRLRQQGLVELLPRLRGRAIERGFVVRAKPLVDLLSDSRVVLGGTSAARLLGWEFPRGTWPVEAYVAETQLAPVVDRYALDRDDQAPDLLLRAVPEPWPFPPYARLVPAVVAAVDLTEAADARLAAFGIDRIGQLSKDIVAAWRQRPPRRRPVRPMVPTGTTVADVRRRRHTAADDLIWDDRAEQDADQLVALLFVAATPLRRTVVAETLRISQGRLSRACTVLDADPPRGLRLEESGDQLGLVSAPECAATVERHLGQPAPEPLSQAALDTLAIVAYEQPVTRADIRTIRGVDSDAVVETLRARGLVAEDARFGGRGRPAFLITTPAFLRYFGLTSLRHLPPRGGSLSS